MFAVAVVLWGGLITYFLQPYIHGNQDAINLIVTVFSILAGILVAVITFVGDPNSLPQGSWRVARRASTRTYNRLTRKKQLFSLYLLTLVLIFGAVLIKGKHPEIELWIERIYLFLAICAFIVSFRLPAALMQLQGERIEQEILSRRENAGINDHKTTSKKD